MVPPIPNVSGADRAVTVPAQIVARGRTQTEYFARPTP
jgi:hypothetical protein